MWKQKLIHKTWISERWKRDNNKHRKNVLFSFTDDRVYKCHYRFSSVLQVLGIKRYQRISNELKRKGVDAAIHLPYLLARNVLKKVYLYRSFSTNDMERDSKV